ncbi:exonuclease SbcCD subunit D [Sphingomonas sp. Leaf37]|uniref:exonuclease SbcCD subunit D n=1 Tax=Sphingomonas sp. Leaf37 TaxID=2876552 RepID=UPI001E3258DE|nr:exonuclease SbcCD subunit D [Sphingomonas sp. Leaf37]
MRILHTGDWHLGRQFFQLPLDEDHDVILAQIDSAILEHSPDVLIIAGDIFDRAGPPQTALARLRDFLVRATANPGLAIVIIAGNHDAAAQIGMLGVLAPIEKALIRGPLDADDLPMILEDEHGPVAISALPFSYEFAARACFDAEDISCPADVIAAQVNAARDRVPAGARWIVVAHSFVEGAASTDSERSLSRTVGGIETVSAEIFEGAHYVALGHLHRAQSVGASHIRYSGSPLAFGFDEEGQEKSLTLIDMAADGSVVTTAIPLTPRRQARTIRGTLKELVAAPVGSDDFIRVVLTDGTPQIDPMKRIRVLYPNAVQLSYERAERTLEEKLGEGRAAIDDPETLVSDFIEFVRGEAPGEFDTQLVNTLIHDARQEIEA